MRSETEGGRTLGAGGLAGVFGFGCSDTVGEGDSAEGPEPTMVAAGVSDSGDGDVEGIAGFRAAGICFIGDDDREAACGRGGAAGCMFASGGDGVERRGRAAARCNSGEGWRGGGVAGPAAGPVGAGDAPRISGPGERSASAWAGPDASAAWEKVRTGPAKTLGARRLVQSRASNVIVHNEPTMIGSD